MYFYLSGRESHSSGIAGHMGPIVPYKPKEIFNHVLTDYGKGGQNVEKAQKFGLPFGALG